MNAILSLGKWFLIVPTLIFGMFHFMNANEMAAMAPGGSVMVYITGACLILAGISMAIGKMDKLASTLLGILFLAFILPHVQMMADDPSQMGNILKNIVMASAAFMYASAFAKDNA
ncbi:MAG: hypothetical protein HKN09_08680, partial [Saprospiraceae bacterium]|nr:hypothetical protein [Saprospiraceae bacterium]